MECVRCGIAGEINVIVILKLIAEGLDHIVDQSIHEN